MKKIICICCMAAMLVFQSGCAANVENNATTETGMAFGSEDKTEQKYIDEQGDVVIIIQLGAVSLYAPSGWGSMISGMEPGMEPFDGSMFSTWDGFEIDNQPVFQIQRWLLGEDMVSPEKLLLQIFEGGHLQPDVSEVKLLFDHVYAAVAKGINTDENSWYYGMYEYNIRLVGFNIIFLPVYYRYIIWILLSIIKLLS